MLTTIQTTKAILNPKFNRWIKFLVRRRVASLIFRSLNFEAERDSAERLNLVWPDPRKGPGRKRRSAEFSFSRTLCERKHRQMPGRLGPRRQHRHRSNSVWPTWKLT